MPVTLALLELVALAEPGENPLLRLLLRQPGKIARGLVHPPVGADHHRLRKPVRPSDFEVEGIVARRHLERAGAEVALDPVVGDHGHAALDVRNHDLAADELAVALVVRVHRDRNVGEDRGGPRGRDHDPTVAVYERVPDVGKRVVGLHVDEPRSESDVWWNGRQLMIRLSW